jgi:membrane protein required for colicin V production
MNTLDIIIIIPLVFGAFKGFRKGLVMELLSLLALVLAVISSFYFMHKGVALLEPHLGSSNSLLPVFSFVIIFIVVLMGVFYLGKVLKKVLDVTLLGSIDDVAGAILGMLKWGLVFSVFLWLFDKGGIILPDHLTQKSILYPYVVSYAPVLLGVVTSLLPFADNLVNEVSAMLEKFAK